MICRTSRCEYLPCEVWRGAVWCGWFSVVVCGAAWCGVGRVDGYARAGWSLVRHGGISRGRGGAGGGGERDMRTLN